MAGERKDWRGIGGGLKGGVEWGGVRPGLGSKEARRQGIGLPTCFAARSTPSCTVSGELMGAVAHVDLVVGDGLVDSVE